MLSVKWVQGIVISLSLLLGACSGGGDDSGGDEPTNSAPTAAISTPAAGSIHPEGSNISLTGTGSDSEDGALSGTALEWSSSIDGLLGTDTSLATMLATGNHTITLKATDSGGKTATDTISITVNAAPLINSVTATPASVNSGVQTTFNWSIGDTDGDTLTCGLDTDADGTDDYTINDCANNTSQAHIFNQAGTFQVRLNVTDGVNAEVQQTVDITVTASGGDSTAPEITLLGANPLNLSVGDTYTDPGATAADNVDGDITGNIIVAGDTVDTAVEGTYVVTYDVTDAAGNAATQVTRTVKVEDNTAPLITLLGANPLNISVGDTYTDPGATAADNVDGDITGNIVVAGDTVDTAVEGTYVVTYDVSDSAGNPAVQLTRTVNVVNDPPLINGLTVSPDPAFINSAATFSWDVSDINGDTLTCTLDIENDGIDDYTINDCANSASQMHTFNQAGTFQVRLSVSDGINTPEMMTIDVTVTVNAVNIQPIADAGEDLEVLGQEYVVITGSGTDDDGSIVSYEWSQILGDSLLMEGQNSSVLSFEAPLVIGTELLRFQLTVIDDQGGVASDIVDVNVTDRGSRQVVSATGMRAVGYPEGYVYYGVDTPAIGRSGHVAFFGVADTSIRATNNASNSLWAGMPDNLRLIIKEGDAVDGLPSNIQFEGDWRDTPPVVTKSGNIGFFATLRGAVNSLTNVSIMAQVNQALISVIRTGISAPGLPPTSVVSGLSDFSFTDGGMLISGTVDRVNSALWYWDYNTVTLIAMADLAGKYSVPEEVLSFDPNCSYNSVSVGENILYSFGGGGISNQGHAVFFSTFIDRDCSAAMAILGWKGGTLYKISDTSDVIENMVDAKFNSMSVLDVNDNGDVLIGTSVRQPGQGTRLVLWLIPDGATPKLVAMEGELAPDEYAREIVSLFTSTFLMSNSGKVFGSTLNLLGGVSLGVSLLHGVPRNSQPYEYLNDVGASQLELVLNHFGVPPGYSPESVIGFVPEDPISINSSGDIVFSADVYDAVADATHTSIWIKRNATEAIELIKPGQTVRINGSEQALTNLFFQGGSTTKGSAAQYDDTGRLFIRARTNNTFQANVLVTPES